MIALLWLAALQTPLDTGTFVVRHDTVEVAREAFRLSRGRATSGRDGIAYPELRGEIFGWRSIRGPRGLVRVAPSNADDRALRRGLTVD